MNKINDESWNVKLNELNAWPRHCTIYKLYDKLLTSYWKIETLNIILSQNRGAHLGNGT